MGQGSGIAVSCGVASRCSLDLALLWLWCRLAAVALIQSLAWELPYAANAALKSKKKKKERERERFLLVRRKNSLRVSASIQMLLIMAMPFLE